MCEEEGVDSLFLFVVCTIWNVGQKAATLSFTNNFFPKAKSYSRIKSITANTNSRENSPFNNKLAKPPTSDDNDDRLIVSGGVIIKSFYWCCCSRCCPLVGIDDDDDDNDNGDDNNKVVVSYNEDVQMT